VEYASRVNGQPEMISVTPALRGALFHRCQNSQNQKTVKVILTEADEGMVAMLNGVA
jgi:hypothetical protein